MFSVLRNQKTYLIRQFMKHQTRVTRNFASSSGSTEDPTRYGPQDAASFKNLRRFKRISASILFGGTLLTAWLIKQKKLTRLKNALDECEYVPLQKNLFKSNVTLYRHKNFMFLGHIVESGVLQELLNFEFRESDVIVASFPKAGTTWLQEIVYMLCNNQEKTGGSSKLLETRFPYLEYPYPGIKSVAAIKDRRFIKTHLPFSVLPPSFATSGAKLIYIARNPKDTVVSYYHFMKLLTESSFTGSFEDFMELFISDKVPYSPYPEHITEYFEQSNKPNIFLITFEDMKANPVKSIQDIANFLEISITETEALEVAAATSFISMKNNPSVNYEHWKDIGFAYKGHHFMRKGEVGDWLNHFSPRTDSTFNQWLTDHKLPIDFKYE